MPKTISRKKTGSGARVRKAKQNGAAVDVSKKAGAIAARMGKEFYRTEAERERDIAEACELHLKRYFRWEAVAIVNERNEQSGARDYTYTLAMYDGDLKIIYDRWRQSTLVDFNEAKWKEIDTLNMIEREAMLAWQRSIGERRTVTRTNESSPDDEAEEEIEEPKEEKRRVYVGAGSKYRVQIKTESETGRADYLRVALNCHDRRAALLGLTAPLRASGDDTQEGEAYNITSELNVTERARRLVSLFTVAQKRLESGEKPIIDITPAKAETTDRRKNGKS